MKLWATLGGYTLFTWKKSKTLMCWNSTSAMLQRLHQKQWATTKHLCEYGKRTISGELGSFSPHKWLIVQDVYSISAPFEEAIRMVSNDEAKNSNMIPLVFFLSTYCMVP